MKLKAICAAAVASLALSGLMAGSAAADTVVLWPSAQEMAEHPGMSHSSWCDMSEAESRESQFTSAYAEKANAEGKCHEKWEVEAPLGEADAHPSNVVSAKGARHAKVAKASRKHRHRRAQH